MSMTTEMRQAYAALPEGYAPRMHRAEVLAVHRLGPGMIRVIFGGADMHDYPTTGLGDEFVRLYFPDHPDDELPIPTLTDRAVVFPDGAAAPSFRLYTIRNHRVGQVDIDFVEHGGGIAAAWAEQARPGQRVIINPPRPGYKRPEHMKRQVLVADEPSLPAALRIAESAAADVETHLLAEVRGEEYQLFADAPNLTYTWFSGAGNGRAPSELAAALRSVDIDEETFVWVSPEASVTRHIRDYLRQERGRTKDAFGIRAYWIDEAERARYNALGADVHARIQAIQASDRSPDEIHRAIHQIYEAAGL